MEQYKLIENCGTSTKYYISNHGNVISERSNKQKGITIRRFAKIQITRGFKCFTAVSGKKKNGKYKFKCFYIHRLVAEYFLSNKENFKRVGFKDKDKMNANVSNLYWTNEMHEGIPSFMQPKAIQTRLPNGRYYKAFKTISQASIELGIVQSAISSALKTKRRYTHGYLFELI